MKLIRSIFYAIILIIFFSGVDCRKKDEPKAFIPLDKEFLSYFAFPVGSWWVYEEVNSGEKDSMYVIKYDIHKHENNKEDLDYWRLSYHLSNSLQDFYFWARPNPNIILNDTLFVLTEAYNLVNDGTVTAIRFFYSKKKKYLFSINDNTYIKNIYDSLTVGSMDFYDVYHIEKLKQEYENLIKGQYFAKNIGIIKKEYFDGRIFELNKYYINK